LISCPGRTLREALAHVLNPHTFYRHEQAEHLDLLNLSPVVVLFRQNRHKGPSTLEKRVVGPQTVTEP
jgi:hypothetical protein